METNLNEWHKTEDGAAAPSLDFIRAVADLLETNPEDILTEMGYVPADERELAVAEA